MKTKRAELQDATSRSVQASKCLAVKVCPLLRSMYLQHSCRNIWVMCQSHDSAHQRAPREATRPPRSISKDSLLHGLHAYFAPTPSHRNKRACANASGSLGLFISESEPAGISRHSNLTSDRDRSSCHLFLGAYFALRAQHAQPQVNWFKRALRRHSGQRSFARVHHGVLPSVALAWSCQALQKIFTLLLREHRPSAL